MWARFIMEMRHRSQTHRRMKLQRPGGVPILPAMDDNPQAKIWIPTVHNFNRKWLSSSNPTVTSRNSADMLILVICYWTKSPPISEHKDLSLGEDYIKQQSKVLLCGFLEAQWAQHSFHKNIWSSKRFPTFFQRLQSTQQQWSNSQG